MELLHQEKEFVTGCMSGNEHELRRCFSVRGECRQPWVSLRGCEPSQQSKYCCATVIHLHVPRVFLLLLPSCSFPDMRPTTNFFHWYQRSILDWFPRITENMIGIPAKRLGFHGNPLVPEKDAALRPKLAECTVLKTGLVFARRNKACVFSLFIFWNSDNRKRFPLNVLKLGLSPRFPIKIDWNLKTQNTTFWCIEVSFKPSLPVPLDIRLI